MKKFTALAVLLSLALLVPTVHAEMLTPALHVITARSTMIKTGNPHAGVTFTEEDFRNVSSLDTIESVTLTSLPVPTEGVLYLGSVPASVNQEIAGENLDALWDALTGIMYTPADISIMKTTARKDIQEHANSIVAVMQEAEAKYSEITVRILD